jgi:hypothetical protein
MIRAVFGISKGRLTMNKGDKFVSGDGEVLYIYRGERGGFA